MPTEFRLDGTCDPRFTLIETAFRHNFNTGKEVGASVSVIWEGNTVVDLWGGYMDAAQTRPWGRDTLVSIFSTTKMVTALCILHLADRGLVDLDAPLARYWPTFTSHGKDQIRIRHVLSHTAGLPGFTRRISFEDLYDWDRIITLLEAEKPWWEPGTRLGYLTLTYGYLLGEVVRRVTGKTLGQYLHAEITAPSGIDFFIGLPEEEEHRVAEIVPEKKELSGFWLGVLRIIFPAAMKIYNNPRLDRHHFNTRAYRAAEIPAANGIGNARSVAQLGSILASGGLAGDQRVLSREMVERAVQEQVRGRDPIAFGRPSAWGLGVMLQNKELLLGPRSFYATGLGGSVCVMDLERNITLVYVMNKMAELVEGDSRSIPLVQRLWECLPVK